MEDKLSVEEVMHVAHLARVALTPDEVEKYRIQLKVLMNEIDKINLVKGYDEEVMFTPVSRNATLRKDEEGQMLEASVALKNAPRKNGNFIEVPVMINE